MNLDDIIEDIHAIHEDLTAYERKYGVLSETFYESYQNGIEPADDSWVLDWSDWAGAYRILLRRREQYRKAIQSLKDKDKSINEIITKAARHESIPVIP